MSSLSQKTRIGFGIGDLGGNLFFTIIGFYLLYYLTDVVQLPAALAGTVLMIGKIWDAVTDPVTGYLSDRTRSRWGRRRPYMFIGSILAFFAMGLMFTVPGEMSVMLLFIYLSVVFCLLNTAYTLVNIPYAALLPELTTDFNERTVLTGYRMSFAVLGTFIGAGAVMPIIGIFSDPQRGWMFTGYIMGAIMLASCMVTIASIKEPEHHEELPGTGFLQTYREALRNPVFLKALIPWTLFITGTTMVQGALVYYFTSIFGDSGLFQIALLCLLAMSLLCIPLWVRISKRIGKKNSYIAGMVIMCFGVLAFSLAGERIGPVISCIIMAAAGTGLSTHYVMPHAILPDIVEHDSINYGGIRREGVFSSLWTFMSKIGQAFALALSGWILSLVQYDPNTVASSMTKTGIKLLCGPIPVIFYVAGIIILIGYPINKAYYDRMITEGTI